MAALLMMFVDDPNSVELNAVIAQRDTLSGAEMVRRIDALAEKGDVSAIELLGELYRLGGFGVAVDAPRACDYFARAAGKRGDSTHNLAMCFEQGVGRPEDKAQARVLYGRAADLGWVQAYCALGTMMVSGAGGDRDAAGGVALCRQAAEAGNANAQTDYANYLLMGEAVPKDVVAARRWYTAAAEQKQANAAFTLAQIHWNGDGTPVDLAAAERWFAVAYDGGRKDAAALLARLLMKRVIVTRDGKQVVDRQYLPQALVWIERASKENPRADNRKAFAEMLVTLRGAQ